MEGKLKGKNVAIIATNGVEQSEFEEPLKALKKAEANIKIISLKAEPIKTWKNKDWSDTHNVDLTIDQANSSDYDAVVLPGGVINADILRTNQDVVNFVKDFFDAGKPIAAICHAPWILIETGALRGRNVTSYHSLQTDLSNAGAVWIDEEVVVDNGLVTSRTPKDLVAFCQKMVEEIGEGVHH
ncbi:type 1 glutamine amidotransferase domain-containing protein [Taibaiella soli]|uniref:Protease n=1 Tax=Taibaiella soli TaxID=1649169 RepID=A0A2W2AT90_9BACT|nr:type 1 glutamine amidotransferase domain-containing protein [Taibaiella soli]PZF71184.1 protease [Taibaiella soli]